jgi:hypothetical protein
MKRVGEAKVGDLSRGLMGRLDRTGEARARANLIAAWRLVAGPEVYAHARGFAVRDGELVVFVDTHTWATELAAMGEHYKAALNMVTGKETVTSLRFAVTKNVSAQRSEESAVLSEAGPVETDAVEPVRASQLERDQVRGMAAGIHSEEIREAVISAAIAHLEWRKGIEARNAAEKALQRLKSARG